MKNFLMTTLFVCSMNLANAQKDSFLFRSPLSFYNSDILSYLQVLHKNQQYEKMVPFFTGPLVEGSPKTEFVAMLAELPFGYSMTHSGIREINPKQSWSLTYTRTIYGTQETFKIDCVLQNDTCRVLLDEKNKLAIFKQ